MVICGCVGSGKEFDVARTEVLEISGCFDSEGVIYMYIFVRC